MNRMIGNSVRVLAATAAFATPAAAAHAEAAPTQAEVSQALTQNYDALVRSAESFAAAHPFGPHHVGNVAVNTQLIKSSLGTDNLVDTEIQSGAFNRHNHTTQLAVIDVYTPNAENGEAGNPLIPAPNNLVQVVIYQARSKRTHAPRL